MTEYTLCPGDGCESKVVLWPIDGGLGYNFCCANCWDWTWFGVTRGLDDRPPEDHPGHSFQCLSRQTTRADEKVKELPEGTVLTVMGKHHHDALKAARDGLAPVPPVS